MNLTSTIDESGGFYPMRPGETFDDQRYVVIRKLEWGGYSTVWLARGREYVLENVESLLTSGSFRRPEKVDTSPSISYPPMHQG